jgi:hypothetical protein
MIDSEYGSVTLQEGRRYTASPTDEYNKLLDRHIRSVDRGQFNKSARLAKRLKQEEDRMKRPAATARIDINSRLEAKKMELSKGICSCKSPYWIQDLRASEPARSAVVLVVQ